MTVAIKPKLTQAGLSAILNATNNGLEAKISHIALGDASDTGYTPNGAETELVNERSRVALGSGERVNDFQIHLEGLFDDANDPEFWMREVGFFLEDGTLLAVWSHAETVLGYRTPINDTIMTFDLVLTDIPPASVNVTISGPAVNILFDKEMITSFSTSLFLLHENIRGKIADFNLKMGIL